MMKYFKLQILLVVLMIIGSFPGIYAINMVQHDNSGMNIVKLTVTQGSKIIYVANNGTDRNDGLTPGKPKRNIENAITSANPGATIKLAPGTYQKNIKINKNLTLRGDSQYNTIIDGQHASNCIQIQNGTEVTIINLTIKNGRDGLDSRGLRIDGGGISNSGTLTLENCTITDNISKYAGGIDNSGTLTIKRVIIKNNHANNAGGGIYSSGTLNMENSTIQYNIADDQAGGGINNLGTMTIKGVNIKNNQGMSSGGIQNNGELTIVDSTIVGNTAETGGGVSNTNLLYIYASTITYNRANDGGGIYNSEVARSKAYIDDITVITDNTPNNFKGKPFIPA